MGKKCKVCALYVPHDTYSYLGFCKDDEELTDGEDVCEDFEELTREDIEDILDTRGWIYCNTCQRRIYSKEDLSEHDGHNLVVEQYSDDIASEESPAAD